MSPRTGPLIEQALRDGGIDVGLMFTSDAAMLSADLVALRNLGITGGGWPFFLGFQLLWVVQPPCRLPSPPVVVVTALVVGIAYPLVVAGRSRTIAKVVGGVVITTFATSRVYLGVDQPFDAVLAVALVVAILVNAFRWFMPNGSFPVTCRQGKTAHLDVGGPRVKPANVLVRNGHVILIDVFFVQIRRSPWRQAVDLADMMLVLAVRTDLVASTNTRG